MGWFILLLTVPLSLIFYTIFGGIFSSDIIGGLAFCLTMLVPLLYFSNWDYGLMFRKPTRNEIILAVLMFIGYMIYSILMGSFLDVLGLSGIESSAESRELQLKPQ